MGGGSAGSQGHTMGMDNRNMMTPGGKSTISNVVNESGEVTDYICRISWVPLSGFPLRALPCVWV